MLRFIVRILGSLVRFIFWDSDRVWRDRKLYGRASRYPSRPHRWKHDCHAGKTHGFVYINEDATGRRYTKVEFLSGKKEGNLSRSFYRRDLADLKKCVDQANAWMRDCGIG